MFRILLSGLLLITILACQPTASSTEAPPVTANTDSIASVVDTLLYARHHHQTSDVLSRRFPTLTRQPAIDIQLAMLDRELADGARLVGWKMGGTITDDSAAYDPLFGYILDRHLIQPDSTVRAEHFPGGQVMVEGEIGFVLNRDFRDGVTSEEELRKGVDYVVGAIELAQATAVAPSDQTTPLSIDYVLAAGMGQAGTIVGNQSLPLAEIDLATETVSCAINGERVAEGNATRVYQGPLHALHSLANLLPQHGRHLRKGDLVITGSLYDNPTIDSTSQVQVEYLNLGTITFAME